MIIYNSSYLSN